MCDVQVRSRTCLYLIYINSKISWLSRSQGTVSIFGTVLEPWRVRVWAAHLSLAKPWFCSSVTLLLESIAYEVMWSLPMVIRMLRTFLGHLGTIKLLVKTGEEWGAPLKLSPMISELHFRPTVPSGPMGYDVTRDAQLRYALERDEATTVGPQAICFGSPGIFPPEKQQKFEPWKEALPSWSLAQLDVSSVSSKNLL